MIILIGIVLVFWLKWDSIIGKKTLPIPLVNTNTIQNIPSVNIPSQYNQLVFMTQTYSLATYRPFTMKRR